MSANSRGRIAAAAAAMALLAPLVASAQPTAADHLIVGTATSDRLRGTFMNDFINGRGGGDIIQAGNGSDWVVGARGADIIVVDQLGKERGADHVSCGRGFDAVFADPADIVGRKCESVTIVRR